MQVGGHCHTYTDPATGFRMEAGLQVYSDHPLVKSTFKRFNVTLVPYKWVLLGC